MLMHFMYFNCTKFQGVVQPIFTIFQKISLSAKIHIKFATILYILQTAFVCTKIKEPAFWQVLFVFIYIAGLFIRPV